MVKEETEHKTHARKRGTTHVGEIRARMAMFGAPVLVLSEFPVYIYIAVWLDISIDSNTKRETGRKAQLGNIEAAKVSRSCPMSCVEIRQYQGNGTILPNYHH